MLFDLCVCEGSRKERRKRRTVERGKGGGGGLIAQKPNVYFVCIWSAEHDEIYNDYLNLRMGRGKVKDDQYSCIL